VQIKLIEITVELGKIYSCGKPLPIAEFVGIGHDDDGQPDRHIS
jgi:hypothetical protein